MRQRIFNRTTTPTPIPAPLSPRAPVLIVDDDDDIRDVLRMLLEEEGYCVVEATTATDALAQLRGATCHHVVLLDWVIPGRGESLLYQLEQEPADGPLRRHRFVVLTAADLNRFTAEEQRLIAATCLAAVAKPFDVEALLAVIKRAENCAGESSKDASTPTQNLAATQN